ncbi:hypothetical protein MKW94_028063 [Papaver nudicaule]|uniref:Defensin n=1 Tax=Papaver nudicaule TaxID=74823 RepID=A0AA41UVZ5_PAPNU|nr:hypothetical protein [Papaver nudicaule]
MDRFSMKLVMTIILSLLLLGGFSVEVAGRINAAATIEEIILSKKVHCDYQDYRCKSTPECNSRCVSKGYPKGVCILAVEYCCCVKKQ